MKKLLSILSVAVLIISLSITAFSHSGRTDKYGGHNDNIHGGYHYHCGGHPAHQHPNGVCPYNTAANAGVKSKDAGTTKKSTPKTTVITTEATTETTTEVTTKTTTENITTAPSSNETTNQTYATKDNKKNKKSGFVAFIQFLIVVGGIAGAVAYYKKRKKAK